MHVVCACTHKKEKKESDEKFKTLKHYHLKVELP